MFFFFDKEEIENGENIFERIKHVNEFDEEYWLARELQKALEYTEWRNFAKVIEKAKTACENSGNDVNSHFVEVNKMADLGLDTSKSMRQIKRTMKLVQKYVKQLQNWEEQCRKICLLLIKV